METCKTNVGVAEGWLTLRAPTQDFFDHRRLKELSAAEWARAAGGVATRRPGSSSLSTSKWTESHRPRTEHPTEKDALWVARHELVEDRPQPQRPVQLLPDYMIVRDSERAGRQQFRFTSSTSHQLPRSGLVVSPKFKSFGERPEDVYKAPDSVKHVPSLNLSRAGLKSAPAGYSQVCSVYVDGHRPMTQGAKRLQLLSPSSEVVAAKAAKQNMQARDLSALPAPLQVSDSKRSRYFKGSNVFVQIHRKNFSYIFQMFDILVLQQEALLDRMGPYAGTVPMRTVAVPLLSRDFTQINRHLNIPNELMPESAAIDVTGEEHEGADESDTSVVAFQPLASLMTPRKLEQMTPRQRAAVWQSSEVATLSFMHEPVFFGRFISSHFSSKRQLLFDHPVIAAT